MLDREVQVPKKENLRIVSIVPSQTELLYDLGLGKQIIGQTLFCVYPEDAYKSANKVGGTKKLNIEKIRALNPDIIIANKEENSQEDIIELEKNFPIWISDIYHMEDNYRMITAMGEIFNAIGQASWIKQQIKVSFALFKARNRNQGSCVYFIWKDPFMAAGNNTYINAMLSESGYQNRIEKSRYPEITINELVEINPDFVLLSSEPYPFKEEHIKELKQHLPKAEIKLVNGEMFSWYGSRMIQAPNYFNQLNIKSTTNA